MRLIAKWILVALVILVLPQIVPGIVVVSFTTALIVALLWGFLNAVLKPILLIVAFPITILTLGLFAFVINAAILWGISTIVTGFEVHGFWPAFLGALVVSVAGMIANFILKDHDD
jgi:putative membrane protein